MKKILLLFLSVFCISFASAQIIGQPFAIFTCGPSEVYFDDETTALLADLNPEEYTVTYHLTESNANLGSNPLPNPYYFSQSQVVFARIEQNANWLNYQIAVFEVVIHPLPLTPSVTHTYCDPQGIIDGTATVNLELMIADVTDGQFGSNVEFYGSEADAVAQVNQLPWIFEIDAAPQTVYYTINDWATGCNAVGTATIEVVDCDALCPAPTNVSFSNVTNHSFVVAWTENGAAMHWEVLTVPAGSPPPSTFDWGQQTQVNPYIVVDMICGAGYDVYVRSICDNNMRSAWSIAATLDMPCQPEPGWPINLETCADSGTACFDLTQNDVYIYGTLNPANYTLTYHTSMADAQNGTSPIAAPANYCVTQPGAASIELYSRLENNTTGEFITHGFALTIRAVATSNFTPLPMSQCDEDGDGSVQFDLTTVAAQLNTVNPLSYYTNSNDATSISGANAIANPQAYVLQTGPVSQTATIFVRESIAGECDIVYSLQIFAVSNCNAATACMAANSLCSSLGVPFANTVNMPNAEPGNNYGCLASQPNPTWFYLPISQAGNLNFQIVQNNFNGAGIDVDFICYGPFANPSSGCQTLAAANNIVSCSYSAMFIENCIIQNAQPGQFYLLMVTNFSNQPGMITITQLGSGAGVGEIDCSGIRMTAFLDGNNNGTKDSGEPNFTLGQFHYEKNNDGTVHNITSPNGTANVYEMNPANSYDLSYTVDPDYAANYSVSTASYSNVSIVAGGGMIDYYFPVTVTQGYDDLAVTIIPVTAPNAGFHYTNIVRYVNQGTQAIASGTVTYNKPAAVSINSVDQSGAAITANGFSYNFTNLQPFESREIQVVLQVPPIPGVVLGQTLTATASIVPLDGDVAPENNESVLVQTIVGSWDPNDKMESRGEQVLFNDFGADDFLYYTIRFENTGTAPALDVKIIDVLESQLDETSVRMVAASHDYVLDRTGTTLTWNFEDIQLPYASVDPEGAKGYVTFKVKPKPGFAIGDVIRNTASIYFDFNPAIVTNTFETHFVEFLGVPTVSNRSFMLYPNPAGDYVTVAVNQSETISQIAVYDVLGKKVLSAQSGASAETLDVSRLGSGMYFVEVTTNQGKSTKKLVIR